MNSGKHHLHNLLSILPASRLPFVAFRFPEVVSVEVWARTDGKLQTLNRIDEVHGKQGFLLHPFQISEKHPILFLEPDYKYSSSEAFPIPAVNFAGHQVFDDEIDCHDDEDEIFLRNLSQLLGQIRAGKVTKVVFSRRLFADKLNEKQIATLFIELTDRYPGAMVYYLSFPGYGCWIGATPEILLRTDKRQAHTIALAGTRASGTAQAWNIKEQEEQAIVSKFIGSRLRSSNMQNIICSMPYTFKAGGVEHLRTDFTFNNPGFDKLCRLIHALHPTPAVGGWPLKESLSMIEQFEKRSREYYTGFLGTIGMGDQLDLFVNIRCMKVAGNGLMILSGAGITEGSDPMKELEEIRMKADTLLAIIEKIRNLAV
ncbi:MAG TPA: chorismate-binding protein [Bacteroidales bacterium]|nr:chorismate-binding protein [Bacteroidales bacterium]